MSDSMVESGHKVESHFALLIFLKFITSVVPYVQFDTTGDLLFSWGIWSMTIYLNNLIIIEIIENKMGQTCDGVVEQ